ncbi:protein TALPID3 isoform X3 [Oryzias melastigma]|uniref:protein TALPID3 isoform X3 n=1 Tax=Oryzias melastigma TaxID=30732 RepID=UPI000CF7FD29|nr:protein TALPID3 isoform X3 [Oryzias melastigma]
MLTGKGSPVDMFSSSSPSLPHGHSSVRSSCGSETAEVLLRSTRVLLSDRSRGSESGPRSVHISVQKLPDSTGVRPKRTEPEPKPKKHTHPPGSPEVEPEPGSSSPADEDVLTSRFTAGGRGVVLGALRRRSNSASNRKEVRVQLLDRRTKNPQNNCQAAAGIGVQTETTAPPIGAPSDLETRVSRLLEDIHNLLDSHRRDDSMGRSLSQQTLQHLDALQRQQLQLQGQLLESALKIVTGHASPASDVTPSVRPQRLQVTTVNGDCCRQHGCSTHGRLPVGTAAPDTPPVTMETHHRDSRPQQLTRVGDGRRRRSDPSVSAEEALDLQALAGQSQEAARRAQEMLREMQRLKTEMKTLMTQPQEPTELTRPETKHLQVQPQSKDEPHQNQSHQNQPNDNHSRQRQSNQTAQQQTHPPYHQAQPQENPTHQNQHHQPQQQSHQPHFQPDQFHSRQSQSNRAAPQQNHPPYHQSLFHQENPTRQTRSELLQRRPAAPSKLEEAGRVLRQAQRQKKVLEENLEVLLKARTGEVLHCQLQALTANRDYTEEVRIKKAVDAWISVLNRDTQTHGSPAQRSTEDAVRSADPEGSHQRAAGRAKPVSTLRGAGRKPGMAGPNRASRGAKKLQEAEPIKVTNKQQLESDAEAFLARLYGKVPHEGLRRTLKKSPYPRFSSPASPLGRRPRPRLVESVRGVKLKSCKTQTSYAPPQLLAPPIAPLQPHSPLSPSHFSSPDPVGSANPADGVPVGMAVPLGRPRMDSRVEIPQEMTSSPAVPASTDVVTVETRVPEPQKQHMEPAEAPPPSSVDIFEGQSEKEEEEEEEEGAAIPPDNTQEEASGVTEEALVLDGGPTPSPVLYHGPAFPPTALSPPTAQDLSVGRQQASLEARLVEWVEQQLMSRIISEMYRPPPPDPVHSYVSDQSELEERSLASDIVEAAGGEGLQLFVDTNTPVDSDLIRQLVSEVLTETITQMFGERAAPEPEPQPEEESLKAAGGEAEMEENMVPLVPLVPTPVLTPEPSMTRSSRNPSPITTPPPSQPSSPASQAPPQSISGTDPVATPTNSPEPRLSEQTPSDVHQAPPPLHWEDSELPLDEEKPEEVMMENKQQLIMSVAEEEPPLISPFPPPPPPPPLSPAPSLPAGSPSSSSEEPTGSSSSSSTVTAETEAALKHISEGELLISINQQELLTENGSFSSSLQEVQDMEFDTLTSGEVRGGDPQLLMSQTVSHTGSGLQLETEEEMSLGEVRDYETPGLHRSTNTGLQENIYLHQTADLEEPGVTERDVQESSIRPHQEPRADSDSSTNDIF